MTSTNAQDHACCRWCGGYHTGACPRVTAIEYHPNGSNKRVEFQTPTATWTRRTGGPNGRVITVSKPVPISNLRFGNEPVEVFAQ